MWQEVEEIIMIYTKEELEKKSLKEVIEIYKKAVEEKKIMTSLKRKLRKVKYDYAHSVWLSLKALDYYKNRFDDEYNFGHVYKYERMASCFRQMIKDYDIYIEWKTRYEQFMAIKKKTNKFFNYLGLEQRMRYE